jgi:hypothetical protein
MDKTVMIAAIVAIVAVLAVTVMLNPGNSSTETGSTTTDNTETTTDNTDNKPQTDTSSDKDEPEPGQTPEVDPSGEVISGGYLPPDYEYDPNDTKIIGDYKSADDASGCKLYKSSDPEDEVMYKCFGTANGIQTKAPNYYLEVGSDKYFCTATPTGCGTSEKVYFQWMD